MIERNLSTASARIFKPTSPLGHTPAMLLAKAQGDPQVTRRHMQRYVGNIFPYCSQASWFPHHWIQGAPCLHSCIITYGGIGSGWDRTVKSHTRGDTALQMGHRTIAFVHLKVKSAELVQPCSGLACMVGWRRQWTDVAPPVSHLSMFVWRARSKQGMELKVREPGSPCAHKLPLKPTQWACLVPSLLDRNSQAG